MKINLHRFNHQAIKLASIAALFGLYSVGRAQNIWTGGGSDLFWQTAANWQGGVTPSAGGSLVFVNVTGLLNTNNFPAATAFGSLTIQTPAGGFSLNGNSITLNGNITNNQPVTEEDINFPLSLAATSLVDVAPNGLLVFNGPLSGSGGLTTVDSGVVSLNAVNSFTGGLTVDAGTVTVSSDANLGAAPGSAAPGNIVINGGILRTTNNFTLNVNRGIAVGSAAGGMGTIKVDTGITTTYGGVIAGNGGAGGLAKSSFGGLTLFGANTYTGPTIIKNGTLKLDFTQAAAPANNIINGGSALTLGGETAGVGQTNNATLLMGVKAATVNSQTFNGTLIDVGGEIIQATNGSGGTANLALGAITHNVGGAVVILPPAKGNITTTSGNNNGILGGWAVIGSGANQNGAFLGTNFATVDINGNITNYFGYLTYGSGNLAGQVNGATNLLLNQTGAGSPVVMTVDSDNANSTTIVNSIKILNPYSSGNYSGVYIGPGNTLCLGQFGGILAQEGATAPVVIIGGINNSPQASGGNGTSGSQDIGTLTAGGAPNTPGEIDLTINNNNETSGSFIIESKITDNGTGPVSFVKTGPGPMKLDGHNTFSGGLYLLQGRLQIAGTEIGTGNPSGGGTGPIYVYPGAELFPSGAGTAPITNAIYIAGNGVSDGVGAIRLSGVFSNGIITMIGDARLGGGGAAGIPIYDQITGAFNLDFGATGNSGSGGNVPIIYNHANNWSGNTTIVGRTGSAGNTLLVNGASDVIPDGFGKGNMLFGNSGNTVSVTAWDMRGFNETVNGLISIGTVPSLMFISNNVANAVSTLTVGNNDQSGTFSGSIVGNIAFTKIGAGVETLTGTNAYTGTTTVNAGTLALGSSSSIGGGGKILMNSGGTLDISTATGGYSTGSPVGLNGGTIIGNGSVGNLGMTNGSLTLNINTSLINLSATALATGGTTNLININSVLGVSSYPAQFTIIQYAGALGGAGNNFGLGDVPNANTVGYVSNDIVDSRIIVVLLNGPKSLTWTGTDPVNPAIWDVNVTTNWLAFKGSAGQMPSTFNTADAATFDDTGSSIVNVVQQVNPGNIEVDNNIINYTFAGAGGIGSRGSITKDGTGVLTFDNGGNGSVAISGSVTINSGTVQMGNNDTNGTLFATLGVVNNSALVFDRIDTTTNTTTISGTGSLSQNGTGVLALSGNNSFSGGVNILQGGVKANSGSALGSTNGTTTVSNGATLDVGGQTLDLEPVIVSGSGMNGLGAIINSGTSSLNAMGNVTLTGNTTFGAVNRWDIRGGLAQLLTGGNNYSLTKIGTNQISIVGANIDGGLGDINVQAGLLSIETTTTGLGNPGNTLTVASGATLQVFNSTVALNKQFVLNGNGVATTFNCGAGFANIINGPLTLTGNCIFNAAAATAVAFTGTIGGTGGMTETGGGTNIIRATAGYAGATVVSNGTLVVDGSLSGNMTIYTNGVLAGTGNAGGAVTIFNGGVSPGDIAGTPQGILTAGTLTLSNATATFELGTSPTNSSGNDKLFVTGGLSLSGTNTLSIVPLSYMNNGDNFTNIQYGGSPLPSAVTNNLRVVSSRAGFTFHLVDPGTTPGYIVIHVDTSLGNDFWTGANSANWDTNTADINWSRNGGPANFNNNDYANFDDTSVVTNVNLSGVFQISGITMNNNSSSYHFGGSGSLGGTGGLQLNGNGMLTIANVGSNSFAGPVTISAGILQIGDGGTNGALGSGLITNNSFLVFNRSGNLIVNNVISGGGALTNTGIGVVTLNGANTFSGNVTVQQGTLKVGNSAALGNGLNTTFVNNGATLDVSNSANIFKETIFVSGTGVSNNGAIINSSGSATFVGQMLGNLTLTADTTFGGSGRIDIRASSAAASDATLFTGNPYALTKVGTNLLQLAGVQIDPGMGDINVRAGILGIQWNMPLGLGDSSHNLTVSSNASFAFFDLSNSVSKVLILNDGASVLGQDGTNNVFTGPVTLQGSNTFNVSSGSLEFMSQISGTGNLVKTGAATLILSSAAENYTGNTYVNQGTLGISDIATISSSPNIVLSNATIDVSSHNDDTLTLGSAGNQTLAGGGTIIGNLMENSGSTVNPGNGSTTATLTVSNTTTLAGAVIMNLNRTNLLTNDKIISPVINTGGTLTVANLGPDLITSNRFQLFSIPVSGFTAVNLPSQNAAHTINYVWQNNLNIDGSILLLQGASPVNGSSTNIVFSAGGGNLNLSWPADHTGWRLQVQTNSLLVGLGTNWFDVPNSTNVDQVSIPINPASGAVFYRLVYP